MICSDPRSCIGDDVLGSIECSPCDIGLCQSVEEDGGQIKDKGVPAVQGNQQVHQRCDGVELPLEVLRGVACNGSRRW